VFERIRTWIQGAGPLVSDQLGTPASQQLQVATVVLLLETAYGDTEYVPAEHKAIRQAVQREFKLGRRAADRLIARGGSARPERGDFGEISKLLVDSYSVDQRRHLVALVWKIVHADRKVEEFEEVFADYVAKLAGLTPEQGREARALAESGAL
jgi:uncharacterized tellurite resistance protein B-like protein